MKKLLVGVMAVAGLALVATALPNVAGTAGAAGTDGEVTGRIVNAANGKPLKAACFTLWTNSPSGIITVQADASGNYDATNLPEGYWEASAGDCSAKPKFDTVVYDNLPGLDGTEGVATYVNVLGGGVPTTGINFALSLGGKLKVKVVDSVTHKGISGASVCPYASATDTQGNFYQTGYCYTTNAKGVVKIPALVAGQTTMAAYGTNYDWTWYGGTDFPSATRFTITAKKTTALTMTLVASS